MEQEQSSSPILMEDDDLRIQMDCTVSFVLEIEFQKRSFRTAFKENKWKRGFAILRGSGLFVYRDPDINHSPLLLTLSLKRCFYEDFSTKKQFVWRLLHDGLGSRSRTEECSFYFKTNLAQNLANFQEYASPFVQVATTPSSVSNNNAAQGAMPGSSKRLFSLFRKPKHIKSPTKSFGVSLEDYFDARPELKIPVVVLKCIEEMERRGLDNVGIYRQNGFVGVRNELKNLFDEYECSVDLSDDEKWNDIYTIAALLKLYFRELPETIFTEHLYQNFLDCAKIEDEREAINHLSYLIKYCLPPRTFTMLGYLFSHLKRLRDNEENKMEPLQISICWGPTLFTGFEHLDGTNKVTELIVKNVEIIFEQPLPQELAADLAQKAQLKGYYGEDGIWYEFVDDDDMIHQFKRSNSSMNILENIGSVELKAPDDSDILNGDTELYNSDLEKEHQLQKEKECEVNEQHEKRKFPVECEELHEPEQNVLTQNCFEMEELEHLGEAGQPPLLDIRTSSSFQKMRPRPLSVSGAKPRPASAVIGVDGLPRELAASTVFRKNTIKAQRNPSFIQKESLAHRPSNLKILKDEISTTSHTQDPEDLECLLSERPEVFNSTLYNTAATKYTDEIQNLDTQIDEFLKLTGLTFDSTL